MTPGEKDSETNESGGFAFNFLTPGEYRLNVDYPGYWPANLSAAVAAGELTDVRILLKTLPEHLPFHETTLKKGLWTCAVDAIWGVPNCGVLSVADQENAEHGYGFEVHENWNETVMELTWKNSNAGSATVPGAQFNNLNLAGGCFGNVYGVNPLWYKFRAGEFGTGAGCDSAAGNGTSQFPTGAYSHHGFVFPWGILANETDPLYNLAFKGRSYGVGVAVSQPFELFATIFYFGSAPGGFTAIADG